MNRMRRVFSSELFGVLQSPADNFLNEKTKSVHISSLSSLTYHRFYILEQSIANIF